jgi:hypothetical protein
MRAKGRVAVAACMKEGGKNRWRDVPTMLLLLLLGLWIPSDRLEK